MDSRGPKIRNAVLSPKEGPGLQAVNSLDGAVVDAITLTKPPGWRPDQSARLHTLALFHANYTPTWLELSGINGPAEELIFQPAEALLFSEPELLDSLRNATLIQVRPCLLSRHLCLPVHNRGLLAGAFSCQQPS